MSIPSRLLREAVLPLAVVSSFFIVAIAYAFAPTANGGPGDLQNMVPVDAFINREFDMTLSGATVNTGSVLLQRNTGNTQNGTASGQNLCTRVGVFNTANPKQMITCDHAQLSISSWYTATFTTGIRTSTGMALNALQAYRFQTSNFAGGGNFIPPATITNYVPRGDGMQPINSRIRVYFRPGGNSTGSTLATAGSGSVLSPSNIQLFVNNNGQPSGSNLLACTSIGGNPAGPTDCNMAWDSKANQLFITPGKKAPAGTVATSGTALTAGTQYLLVIKGTFPGGGGGGGSRVTVLNTDGGVLALPGGASQLTVPFTATGAQTTGPNVKASYPTDAATGVDRAIYNITLGFTEALDPATVTGGTLELFRDGGNGTFDNGGGDDTLISGTSAKYDAQDSVAYLSPNTILAASTKYWIVVTPGDGQHRQLFRRLAE